MEEILDTIPLDELQSKLKQKFPELKDADLHTDANSKKDMMQMICYKLRKTKDEMLRIIQFL